MVVGSAIACGQELALPDGYGQKGEGEPGPMNGLTGAGGASAEGVPGKLPVIDNPRYTTFGGAAGGEDEEAPRSAGRAGKSSGGTKGKGGTGGSPSTSEAGVAGSAGAEPEVARARLLFSEYLEDPGSFKALEVLALEGGSLEGCELQTYFNGKAEPARLALHGSLDQGALLVLCSSKLAEAEPAICPRSTNLTFNGDDALALACDGVLHDIIGEIGVDPGASWGNGATLDHGLRRRCSITVGRSDPLTAFMVDAEWELFAPDVLTDLGKRSCD